MKTIKNTLDIAVYPIQNSPTNIITGDIPDRWQQEIFEVLSSIFERDYAPRTKEAVLADVRQFMGWYQEVNQEVFQFRRCVQRDCIDYKHMLISEWKSANTINRRLSHLKIFFSEALEMEYTSKSPMQWIKQLPKLIGMPKALSQTEYRRLLREVELRGSIRDKVIIELMSLCGLRCWEVVRLQYKYISLAERSGKIDILHSKGNKSRAIPIPLELRNTLKEFIDKCPPMTQEDFLCQWQRGTLTESGIAKMLNIYGGFANVVLSPHTLRHTFAENFLKSNPSDINALSSLLGHSSILTTSIYTKQRFSDLQEKMEKINL